MENEKEKFNWREPFAAVMISILMVSILIFSINFTSSASPYTFTVGDKTGIFPMEERVGSYRNPEIVDQRTLFVGMSCDGYYTEFDCYDPFLFSTIMCGVLENDFYPMKTYAKEGGVYYYLVSTTTPEALAKKAELEKQIPTCLEWKSEREKSKQVERCAKPIAEQSFEDYQSCKK